MTHPTGTPPPPIPGPATSPATNPAQNPRPKPLQTLLKTLDAPWIDRSRLDARHATRRTASTRGMNLYAALAALFLFAVSGPTSIAEFAGLPLALCFLAHLRRKDSPAALALVDPRFLLILALAAWMTLSLLWSNDPSQGLQEIGALRWAWTIPLLYPVLDRRKLLITAYAIGLLAGNASQLLHALQPTLDIQLFTRAPGRLSGWWDPVVGGSILCAALGLHLPAAIMGSHRTRILGVLGSLASFAGIIATGSRGPWIAAAILIGLVSLVAILRVRPRQKALVPAAITAALLAITLATAAWTLRDSDLASRVTQGYNEIRNTLQTNNYNSDTGARIYMNMRAAQAFAHNPVQGVGAGGYQPWVNAYDPENAGIAHVHAHSAPLHAAATLGLVGLAIITLLFIAVFRAAYRAATVTGNKAQAATNLGSYAAGPLFALTGLMLVGLFDPVQINAQTAAQLAVLIALCPPVLPTQYSPNSP